MIKLKLWLVGLLLIGLAGCLPPEAKQKQRTETMEKNRYESASDLSAVTVGYCTPTLDGPFYMALEVAVKEAVQSYGMQYISTDGQGDINKQVMAVEDLLSKNIQVLILNPLDPKALVPIVKSAHEKGVAVFILDSSIDDAAPYIASTIANNQLNGEILGQWLAQQNLRDLKIAMISGNQGNPVGREKRLGFIRGLADGQLHQSAKSAFSIVAQGWGNWNNNGGLKAMEDILVAHPNVNVLVAENDAMALGALRVINQMGMKGQIAVIGFDGQKEAYEKIKSGEYAATAQNSPRILGQTMVEMVVRHLNGEPVNKVNYTPSVLITNRNVNEFHEPDALF